MLIAILIGGTSAASAGAQLTLGEAMRQADRASYGNRIAASSADAQSAQALRPLKGILPSIRFEAGYIRTTDPIGVFGSILRQRAITAASFDPQRLNDPDATGNYQGGIVIEQPLFNADAWTGRRAASRAANGSREAEAWTRLSTRVDVVRAFYGGVLSAERGRTLQAALLAARANVTQSEAMVRQGLVTKSDALLASVRAGDVETQLAEADGASASARRQLAVLLGGDGGSEASELVLPSALPSAERIRAVVASDTAAVLAQPRADVRAAESGLAATRADLLRARSAYLPRLNSFARYDWNSANRLYGGDRNWTVGVMTSWSPFAGASELAEIQVAAAAASTAAAQAEAARANASLDIAQTRTTLAVALARLAVAERAVTQSAEANRIVGRKYAGGLASVMELLDAQAVETERALGLSQARWSVIVTAAERRRALGLDPATLTSLDTNPEE